MHGLRTMFRADWREAMFIHFRVPSPLLQPVVPFTLDTIHDDAFISLVAFTQSNLRPAFGGRIAAMLSAPLAEHEFLNLRAYVHVNGEPAIYFMAEWIPNRLAVLIGPRLYGLPYRLGSHRYDHDNSRMRGTVTAPTGRLEYDARATSPLTSARPGCTDWFFVERYLAFTHRKRIVRAFRVGHDPWPLCRADVRLEDRSLLDACGSWAREASIVAAHYSPGVRNVSISAPRRHFLPFDSTSTGTTGGGVTSSPGPIIR